MALSEKFSHRGYVISVFAVCLGGVLIGFLLATTLTVNGVLILGPDELTCLPLAGHLWAMQGRKLML